MLINGVITRRERGCATSGPAIWMQKESSQNLIFFIVFCNGTDVHNQDPRLPREYRDSDSPILHTFRGISPRPREGKRSLQNRFSDFEALMASLAATDFLGRGLHARTLRVDRYGYREGRERERKGKRNAWLREIIRDV